MGGRGKLAVLLLAGASLRLAGFAPGGFPGDVQEYHSWMVALANQPAGDFYQLTDADHLPGDIAALWGVANLLDWVQLGSIGATEVALKSIATACDLVAGAICFWIGERLRRGSGPLAAGLYLLNPGFILTGAIWGQLDAISAMLGLGGVALLLGNRLVLAVPCVAWATLVKPSFAVLLPLLLLALRRGSLLQDARRLALGAAVALALAGAIVLPFDTALGPIGSGDQLTGRVKHAIEREQLSTINALNVWALADGTPGLPLPEESTPEAHRYYDRDAAALGISSRDLGAGLTLLALGFVYVRLNGRRDGVALLWAAMAAFVVLWLLPTRIHERYLFPAIAFGAPLAAVTSAQLRALWAVLGAGWTVNVLWVYDLGGGGSDVPLLDLDPVHRILALVMLITAAALLVAGPPAPPPTPPSSASEAVRRPGPWLRPFGRSRRW